MEKYTREGVREKVVQFCDIFGYNDEKIISNCLRIIDKYLSFENSSIDKLYFYLDEGIRNFSWRLIWENINEEIDKLSGQYDIKQEKIKTDRQNILLSYEALNLGERFFDEEELKRIKVNLGVIDANGVFHTSERLGIPRDNWPDHRQLANYLKLGEKIVQYYIRVGCICGINDGILCAESLSYGNETSLKNFLLTIQKY